ncbi:hypothetical protein [Kamptonema formosum]|uniref:hypothetical protein n=1 Tax=Kamptonema formosum TaxID=331992 RepID=UPI001E456FD9|nr:hypothetical protein [Oscillatoria sp. PCC 10802]
MGAIASGGVRVLNEDVVRSFQISLAAIERVAEKEQQELERRERLRTPQPPRARLARTHRDFGG